jgi:hypothetical protein
LDQPTLDDKTHLINFGQDNKKCIERKKKESKGKERKEHNITTRRKGKTKEVELKEGRKRLQIP